MTSIPYSVLDLCPVVEGGSAADTFRDTVDLARHAERWGYQRYWLAEHHNMPGIASAATAVVIGHVAAGTTTIRVGAGGVMPPFALYTTPKLAGVHWACNVTLLFGITYAPPTAYETPVPAAEVFQPEKT